MTDFKNLGDRKFIHLILEQKLKIITYIKKIRISLNIYGIYFCDYAKKH